MGKEMHELGYEIKLFCEGKVTIFHSFEAPTVNDLGLLGHTIVGFNGDLYALDVARGDFCTITQVLKDAPATAIPATPLPKKKDSWLATVFLIGREDFQMEFDSRPKIQWECICGVPQLILSCGDFTAVFVESQVAGYAISKE